MKKSGYKGKIGRLPAAVRDEVCQRILDGQPGSVILPWLNGLAAVKEILRARFGGARINDKNLTEWRQGGFQDWINERGSVLRLKAKAEMALALTKAANGKLSQGAAAIAAGQLMEMLEAEDDTEHPAADAVGEAAPKRKRPSISDLVNGVVAIQGGEIELQKLELKKLDGVRADRRLELEEQKYMRETSELVQKAIKDKSLEEQLSKTGDNTAQLELIGKTIFGDRWKGVQPAA